MQQVFHKSMILGFLLCYLPPGREKAVRLCAIAVALFLNPLFRCHHTL